MNDSFHSPLSISHSLFTISPIPIPLLRPQRIRRIGERRFDGLIADGATGNHKHRPRRDGRRRDDDDGLEALRARSDRPGVARLPVLGPAAGDGEPAHPAPAIVCHRAVFRINVSAGV